MTSCSTNSKTKRREKVKKKTTIEICYSKYGKKKKRTQEYKFTI